MIIITLVVRSRWINNLPLRGLISILLKNISLSIADLKIIFKHLYISSYNIKQFTRGALKDIVRRLVDTPGFVKHTLYYYQLSQIFQCSQTSRFIVLNSLLNGSFLARKKPDTLPFTTHFVSRRYDPLFPRYDRLKGDTVSGAAISLSLSREWASLSRTSDPLSLAPSLTYPKRGHVRWSVTDADSALPAEKVGHTVSATRNDIPYILNAIFQALYLRNRWGYRLRTKRVFYGTFSPIASCIKISKLSNYFDEII